MEIPFGFAQLNFLFTGDASPSGAEMTIGLDLGANALDAIEVAELASVRYAESDLLQFMTNQCSLTGVACKFGPNATGQSGEFSTLVIGTGAGTAVSPQVTVLVRKHTAFGGKAGKGRFYWPAPPEAQISASGGVSDLWITGLATEWQAWHDAMVADDFTPVVLHGAGSPLSTPSPITGYSVPVQCATQRRRNRPS